MLTFSSGSYGRVVRFCKVGMDSLNKPLIQCFSHSQQPDSRFSRRRTIVQYVRGYLGNISRPWPSPAFVDDSSTAGAKFNVYTAGVDGIFSSVLSGATAGPRDASLEGLQTFGGLRELARYVKIEGVPGSGGEFSISEVYSICVVFLLGAVKERLFRFFLSSDTANTRSPSAPMSYS